MARIGYSDPSGPSASSSSMVPAPQASTKRAPPSTFSRKRWAWTREEDELLLRLGYERKKNRGSWDELAKRFEGRTLQAIKQRWTNIKGEATTMTEVFTSTSDKPWAPSWSKEEDELVLRLGAERKKNKGSWEELLVHFEGRTVMAIRQRWTTIKPKSVATSYTRWTPAENLKLRNLITNRTMSWSMIAKQFPGRTEATVTVRGYSMLKSQAEESDLSSLPPSPSTSNSRLSSPEIVSKPLSLKRPHSPPHHPSSFELQTPYSFVDDDDEEEDELNDDDEEEDELNTESEAEEDAERESKRRRFAEDEPEDEEISIAKSGRSRLWSSAISSSHPPIAASTGTPPSDSSSSSTDNSPPLHLINLPLPTTSTSTSNTIEMDENFQRKFCQSEIGGTTAMDKLSSIGNVFAKMLEESQRIGLVA